MGRDERLRQGQFGGSRIAGGQMISTVPPTVQDAFGRELQVGDLIQAQLPGQPMFTVDAIEVVTDPGVPEGLMEIRIGARLRFRAPRAQPQQEFVRIRTAAEGRHALRNAEGQSASAQGDGDHGPDAIDDTAAGVLAEVTTRVEPDSL